MLRSLRDLETYAVNATDGEVGRVVDFLLDDQTWRVRFLVIDTGFGAGHKALLAPGSFRHADWSTHRFHVGVTREKVEHSPSVAPADVHLRSANELHRFHVQGTDAAVGHIDDFIVDDVTWELRYFVVDTHAWWVGKKVLVALSWARNIGWAERTLHIDLSQQAIKDSPEWSAETPVNREYELRLFDYYGRPSYWSERETPDT